MAALINSISLGMRQSLLYRLPRTISITPLLRHVRAASSSLPFCLFCAHTVSAAIILADRRLLQSVERKRFGEIRAMTGEIREQMGRISGSLTRMSEGLREHLRGMNDSLRGMNDSLRGMNDSLRGMNDSLRGMNDSLRGTDDSLGAMTDDLRRISDDLREIGNNIKPCMDVGRFRSLGMEKVAERERMFPELNELALKRATSKAA